MQLSLRAPTLACLFVAAVDSFAGPAVSPEFFLDASEHARAPAPFAQSDGAIAWGATNALVVWEDHRAGGANEPETIFATRLGPAGQVLDGAGIRIAPEAPAARTPTVAWLGSRFLVAWEDTRPVSHSEIYAGLVGADGTIAGSSFRLNSTTNSGNQWQPAAASDGTNAALVVWVDYRAGNQDIYGRLIDASGAPLGPADFPICSAAKIQMRPAVAWGGTNFLVAWEDYRNESGWSEGNIFVARVSPSGRVLDANGVAVFPASGQYGYQGTPAVAWGGTGTYLVAWYDYRNGATNQQDIYGRRISPSGAPLDDGCFAIGSATNVQTSPRLSWGGTNFLAVWEDTRRSTNYLSRLYGTRVDGVTNVLDPAGLPVSTNGAFQRYGVGLAWNGTNFMVSWQDYRAGEDESDICTTLVSPAGESLNPTGLLASTAADSQWNACAAWGATNYLVVWSDYLDDSTSDILGCRVGATGQILDPTAFVICSASNRQRVPSVAWAGTNFLVVWQDDRNTNTLVMGVLAYQDVFGARVSSGGQVLDPNGIGICTNPGPQFEPACASDGTDTVLVAWRDYRTAAAPYPSDIYGTRVSSGGAVLDPAGIAICTATNFQFHPSVAWGGTNFLVAWDDGRVSTNDYNIYATRVSRAGAVLDSSAIAVCAVTNDQGSPIVAWGNTNWLVVWEDRRDARYENNLYGARVSPAGVALDPAGLAVCIATAHQYGVTLGWSGTNWLALWSDWRQGYRNLSYGTRVDAGGTVLDSPATGFELVAGHAAGFDPALAPRSNGLFLAAYTTLRAGGLNAQRIAAAFVDSSPLTLLVTTPYGGCAPPPGTNVCVHGLAIQCAVTSSVATLGSSQYVCRGWAGTASVPTNGIATNTGSFVMNNDSTLAWLWTTNFLLSVSTNGRGSVSGAIGWVPFGSNAAVTASPGAHFYHGGWSGDVPPASTNDAVLNLSMTQPRFIAMNFAPYLTTNFIPHWWLADHSLATNDAATYLDPDADGQFTWEEFVADTDPTNVASRFATLSGLAGGPVITATLAESRTDRVYDIAWRTNLAPNTGVWTPYGVNRSGTGGPLDLTVTSSIPNAFHRVSVRRLP